MKDLISYQYIPAETKFTFANGETAKVNWTLHLRYHTTPPCSTNIDILEQGTVPILLSIGQMRNLYMTIEHTPQCDKITCKAFGMNRQAVPVSGTGHALVDLAGVARVKSHGEIARKGLINYVYDDDDSIKFQSEENLKSETVCASKSSETKEEAATPRIIGTTKQDHWIHDEKNKKLIRVHITPRKALFTPIGAKGCPVNPDNISRERTTEIIDATKGGDPEILEDNWRLTSQANKPLINLWKGKTIFTLQDNPQESGSGTTADRIIDKMGQSTIEPDPIMPSAEEPTSLPTALGRIHKRLSNPEELKKLHLQHHHMNTEQFRFRTRALHLPKSIYDQYDKIRSECEVCQAAKQGPSRSKTSGLRADTFGDMTFIDHCQVPLGTGEHITVFVILDGATTLLTAEVVNTTQESENITVLRNYFDQYHLQPKSVVGDQAFMSETWEHFYQSLDITPISLGPNTPWPNRAESAVRLLKAQTKIMLHSIKSGTAPATLKKITYRQLVKAAATVRNQTVTYGGVTPLELAFGRRPADLIQLDVATPTQLTIDRNEEELTAIQIKQLSKQAFQEARQSEDIRRDLAQNLRMSAKPLQVKDKVFYWQEDKSKIRSDGSKGGIWIKGKVISLEGAMVGLDLGTRLIKVNLTKVRKDETIPPGKPGIDFLLPDEQESLQKDQEGTSSDSKKNQPSIPTPKPASSRPLRIAGKSKMQPVAPKPSETPASARPMNVEDVTEDRTSIPEQAHWNCVKKGKIHVLEIFAGSARFSQCCALTGLKVGTPVDIRNGFDVMTSKGRHMVMEIIREQAPDLILMAPVCGPWSNMQNIQQDQQRVWEKRQRYIPMVEFVASIARYQLKHKRYFIIENPQTSRIWYLNCMQQLFSDPSVTWGDFHFCAYGLRDPESGLRCLKPTSLMHCLPPEVMRPIFRRCTNFTSSVKHEHQHLEGNAGTFGSRTKLAQVYPYRFCQDLAHIILRHLKVKPLDNEVYLLEDIFEPFTNKEINILRKEMDAIDQEFNMTSSSTAVNIQDLPFNKNVPPLIIQDSLVNKFQKTLKQYPPGTEIDVFKQNPNDWRCQNMWNGCKKLRQLCISSTQYDACTAYVHTIGINMPINSPPDDACIAFWQPDQLSRIWVLPASKCNWENFNPKTWHAVMYSSVHQAFSDAPSFKPMPIEVDPMDPLNSPRQPDTQQPPDQPDHPMPDPRPPTPPHQDMTDPPPSPPQQPNQPDQPDHPMPPAPPGASVSPDSPVDPPLPPHDRPDQVNPAGVKRQKQSISSSSGLNRLGGDVTLPSQSGPSQPVHPTVVVPSPPAILTNPETENDDEELELPNLEQEETTHPLQSSPPKKQKAGKKNRRQAMMKKRL